MQTTVDTSLSLVDRHKLITAGREFIKLQLSRVLPSIGILPSNLYAWMKDSTRSSVSPEKQLSAMKLYGLLPTGRLTAEELHAWHLSQEAAVHVPVFLQYETNISDVEIRPAVTTARLRIRDADPKRIFVGASVTWKAPRPTGKKVVCRLIITAPLWPEDELLAFLASVFGERSTTKPKVMPKIEITLQACEQVWRHIIRDRAPDGSRVTLPRSMGPLPYNQDIIGSESQSSDPPLSILNDMTARFKSLTKKYYALEGKPVPLKDQALITRAETALNSSET